MLLDGIGGSIHEQSHPAGPEDALVAISFRNYYPDTARLFPELVARGVPAISITDSLLSPIVEGARVVFEIQDMPEPALRTLVAPMCLVPGARHRPRSRGRLTFPHCACQRRTTMASNERPRDR